MPDFACVWTFLARGKSDFFLLVTSIHFVNTWNFFIFMADFETFIPCSLWCIGNLWSLLAKVGLWSFLSKLEGGLSSCISTPWRTSKMFCLLPSQSQVGLPKLCAIFHISKVDFVNLFPRHDRLGGLDKFLSTSMADSMNIFPCCFWHGGLPYVFAIHSQAWGGLWSCLFHI